MTRRLALIAATVFAGSVQAQLAPPGAAPPTQEVFVLARPILRGEPLSAGDFAIETRQIAQARGALSASDIVGKEALRSLSPGNVVRITDVAPLRLVHRGDAVTIAYRNRGLLITTAGRALGDGGSGEALRAVVSETNRTVDGVVAASGLVLVGR
ncbi:flagellar basal body P-ring formation chaperone FlgA [Sphingomonas hylomeconis]|uniref:Flagella basal body P-ring formation protein FlgA n=1 Tax=Sphingomonas hylomeconis TaxID=1395958 RepID=A0ABV7SP44_9SPHN|nr:flagellar basal body P-ring formation chaperone FlgA [Sphingomonas hylomeconis]